MQFSLSDFLVYCPFLPHGHEVVTTVRQIGKLWNPLRVTACVYKDDTECLIEPMSLLGICKIISFISRFFSGSVKLSSMPLVWWHLLT